MKKINIIPLVMGFCLCINIALSSDKPQWAQSGVCQEPDCAVGEASLKEGEMSALARALKELRLSLGVNIQAEYNENTDNSGETKADSHLKLYTSMQNLGYKILDKYQDNSRIYIKIQYDPNKKVIQNEVIPEFDTIKSLEKLCKDNQLDGYYCVSLGRKYQNGENGLAKNIDFALKYFDKGCKMGTLEGCLFAGKISDSARKSKEYFTKACDGGLGSACFEQSLLEDEITDKRDLLIKGCSGKDALSCAFAGEIYQKGLAHVQTNTSLANTYYSKSCLLDKNGDGCVLLWQSQQDWQEIQKLCDTNNAKACAITGDENNNIDLLEKSAMLDSALGYYFLARAKDSTQKMMLLEKSCALGLNGDFTKGCEELGDMYQTDDVQKVQYYSKACNTLFYEESACEKLYEIDPSQCQNEEICLKIKKQKELQQAQANEQAKREQEELRSYKVKTKSHSQLSRIGAFIEMGMPVLRPNLPQLMKESSSKVGFNLKVGFEIRGKNPKFSPFVAPYMGYTRITLMDDDELEELDAPYYYNGDGMNVGMFNVGSYIGVRMGTLRAYGIIDYLVPVSSLSIDNPIDNMLGYGFGVMLDIGLRIGFQYISYDVSYYGGRVRRKWYGDGGFELDRSQTYKSKNNAFMVFIGIGI